MVDEPVSTGSDDSGIATDNSGGPQVDAVLGETAEADPASETTEVTETPEALDPQYVARAQAFNMTEDDLRAVPRPIVERMIAGADKALIEAFRRDQRTPQSPPSAVPGVATTPAPAAVGDFSFDPFELTFNADEEVAEPITKNMKAMQEHSAKQFEKLHQHYEKKFQAVEQFAANTQRQQDYAILDRYIDGLGAEWSGVFGKGATLDMDSRSQEYLKRGELRMAAIETMQINERLTGRALPAGEALPRALNSMFYEKSSAIERERADAKRKKLQDGAAVRPRSGTTGLPMGSIRQRATELAASVRA